MFVNEDLPSFDVDLRGRPTEIPDGNKKQFSFFLSQTSQNSEENQK